MLRFFLEVRYDGSGFSGFQVQENANTIQAEVEMALATLLRQETGCTGSSRTDAGVHAMQNFFHFDFHDELPHGFVYHLNAILPPQIAVISCRPVARKSHCRFDATGRRYLYRLSSRKDPFLLHRAWFYPYPLKKDLLDEAAALVSVTNDFIAFAKRHADVKTNHCNIRRSQWTCHENGWTYEVEANRFLRGMVRGLVSTMLLVGREKMSIPQFAEVLKATDNLRTNFTAPGHGLYLMEVQFPDGYFDRV